jgi:hypothetical protein
MYTEGSLNLKPISNTLKPDGSQHDRSAACIIAQQYSSATFSSQHFQYRKKKNSVRVSNTSLFDFISFLEVP